MKFAVRGLSLVLPLLALGLQWMLWPWISPFVWFLFFPAVFFSARLSGFWGGLTSTLISVALVWYFFIPPQLSWVIEKPSNIYAAIMFLAMGILFSDTQERLRRAQQNTEIALAETRAAKETLSGLYQRSLELDRLKSEFFANISHELRTPLTLIISPLTRRQAADDLPEELRREDEMILRNARLLYRQVSDLLDAAKLEAGQMDIEYARIDIGGLSRTIAAQFASLAREKGIAYRIDVPEPLICEADGEKVQRILLNLLANAFKFTPDNGRIHIGLRQEAGSILIEVADSGPGVPEAMRSLVFERFRQVEGGAQRQFGGTGLGLAIVKEFAELHGGSVWLGDAPDGGALFLIRIPQMAPPGCTIRDSARRLDLLLEHRLVDEANGFTRNSVHAGAGEASACAPLILVVEDNIDMNAFIAETLRPYYRVASAYDGREGLERALALRPDLILCDLMMPQLSGDQLVAELRRQPSMLEVPIVMLSAKADDQQRITMLENGVQDYLGKPFMVDELLARVSGLVLAHRRNAETLSRSEARFAATFEQAAVGIALVAPDGRWLRVNRKLCQIVSYSHDELMLLGFQDITHPDDLQTDLNYLNQLVAGVIENYAMEKRYIRKDGRLVWINLTVALTHKADGSPDYFISVVEDITERKQIEESLKKSRAQLVAFIQHAPVSIAMFDRDMNYLSVSGRWLQDYGRGRAELVGCNHYEVYPDMPVEWRQVHRQGLDGETVQNDEDQWIQADGSKRWLRWAVLPWTDENGEIGGIIISTEDISAAKFAEEAVRQLNADLEHRVLARTAELSAANRELDSFAYAVSHDLRAPLRAMSGFSQALIQDYGDKLQGEAAVFLEQIELASRKMSDLIDGLLALSRTSRGELRLDRINLSGLAAQILAELKQTEPERNVRLEIESGLLVNGDGRTIEVLMRNLLGNAWKYTAKTDAACIRVYTEQVDGGRRFCVADNGAGFDMAHAGRLFHPFQRLHRQEEFPGIGIGLATVQRIVHRHGGTIHASGEPGKGAVFCFTLSEFPAGLTRDKTEAI